MNRSIRVTFSPKTTGDQQQSRDTGLWLPTPAVGVGDRRVAPGGCQETPRLLQRGQMLWTWGIVSGLFSGLC